MPIDKPNNLPAAVEYWKQIGEAVDLPFYIYWMANTADKAVTPEQVRSCAIVVLLRRVCVCVCVCVRACASCWVDAAACSA